MLDNLMMLVVYCDQGSNSKWILLLIFANMMTFFYDDRDDDYDGSGGC